MVCGLVKNRQIGYIFDMTTVTIPKKEYSELLEKKFRYEYMRNILEGDIFSPPPTKSKKEILSAFRQTKNYSKKFLESLKRGLERSSHFKL